MKPASGVSSDASSAQQGRFDHYITTVRQADCHYYVASGECELRPKFGCDPVIDYAPIRLL